MSVGHNRQDPRDDELPECHCGADHLEMSAESIWPTDTDFFFLPGSNKLHLSSQKPLVHLVVGDVIENVQATLLTQNAFPEGTKAASSLVENCLLAVAEQHNPAVLSIHE
jgi:hypothetical protein